MKAVLKRRWIAALRSGKYKQGTGYLKEKDGGGYTYCCLGVLRAIAPQGMFHKRSAGIELLRPTEDLSKEIQMKLADMNDGCGKQKTFRGIATWIEKNL